MLPSAPPPDRLRAFEELVATRYGLSLARYPARQVRKLLDAVPANAGAEDSTLRRLIAACSVGETMFMRHPEQFSALQGLLPELRRATRKPRLRLWSAGCASGEEAFSLAALDLAGDSLEVLGTDLNPELIERARQGRYRPWSLRGVRLSVLQEWLRVDGFKVEVAAPLRRRVTFQVHNLVGDPYPPGLDVIFCRNVLLYFREDMAARVLERFAESLQPGGVLFLGYCDPSPGPGGHWEEQWLDSVRWFRRKEASDRASPPPQPPPEPAPASGDGMHEQLALARGLCVQGAFKDAMAVLDQLTHERPLEIEPHVLAAMVADEAGLHLRALEEARCSYFLARHEPITNFLLGACLARASAPELAQARLRSALALLERQGDLARPLPYGEGLTGHQLQVMIHAQLQP